MGLQTIDRPEARPADESALIGWLHAFAEQGRHEAAWNELIAQDCLWRALERVGPLPEDTSWKIVQAIVAAEEARPVANADWQRGSNSAGQPALAGSTFPATILALAMLHHPLLSLCTGSFRRFCDAFRALILSPRACAAFGPGHVEFLDEIYALWAWDVVRGLPGPTPSGAPRAEWSQPAIVPVAFEGRTGQIAWLQLELLPGDPDHPDRLVHHPRDRLAVIDGGTDGRAVAPGAESFAEATMAAFRRARDGTSLAGDARFEARWRVIDQYDQPVTGIRGNSAGGAALLGWSALLAPQIEGRARLVDPRVLVTGSLAATGTILQPVGGMTKKVQALLAFNDDLSRRGRHPPIDTVIVSPWQLGRPDDPAPADLSKPAPILPVLRAQGCTIASKAANGRYWVVRRGDQQIRIASGFELVT
jgi:hypothetical protein